MNFLLNVEKDFQSKKIEIGKITKISTKEKNLDVIKQVNEDNIIFIIKPNKDIFNVVVEIHLMLKTKRGDVIDNLIFIPKENYDIIEYMTTNNMIAEFSIDNFNIDLIPIDIDLFSLENENDIKDIYIDKNLSCISELANSVVKYETCFGKIKYKYLKGDLAKTFCDLVEEKEKENDLRITDDEILGMIVLDRSVDFITLMTTNYTYEGQIDEKIGINLGRIQIKDSVIKGNNNQPNNNDKKKVADKLISYGLTSNYNKIYCSIRCMKLLDACKYLNAIRSYYENATKKYSKNSLNEELLKMADYFRKFVKIELSQNENLINYIIDLNPSNNMEIRNYSQKEQILLSGELPDNLYSYYDEYLCHQKDLLTLIKLMIIESLTQNGIQGYKNFKREILNIYGFQKIFLFRDLETLGWLSEKQLLKDLKNLGNLSYSQIFNKLELVSEDNNSLDCSYVLDGCCPIGVKLIEKAVYGKWNTIIDVLNKMPGALEFPEKENVIGNPIKDKNLMFIIFVGGVTYTEIEAIRFLNRKFNEENLKGKRKKTQFIILTTSILNSKKILQNLGKDVSNFYSMKMFNEQINK